MTMKVLLDIKDEKAAFVMELLGNLKYVKTKTLTDPEATFLQEFREAVEVKLIIAGKRQGRPIQELLDEL